MPGGAQGVDAGGVVIVGDPHRLEAAGIFARPAAKGDQRIGQEVQIGAVVILDGDARQERVKPIQRQRVGEAIALLKYGLLTMS